MFPLLSWQTYLSGLHANWLQQLSLPFPAGFGGPGGHSKRGLPQNGPSVLEKEAKSKPTVPSTRISFLAALLLPVHSADNSAPLGINKGAPMQLPMSLAISACCKVMAGQEIVDSSLCGQAIRSGVRNPFAWSSLLLAQHASTEDTNSMPDFGGVLLMDQKHHAHTFH